jgi:uncharacterized protein YcbK (DUF882 family)
VSLGPSPHLRWSELACKDAARTPYPHEWMTTRAVELAREFEAIRAAVGAPLLILSAYRTPEHNRHVGGAKASQHVQGRALDLRPPTGCTLDRFYALILERARRDDSALWGVGRYPAFVHIDTRPKPEHGRLTVWRGSEAWTEGKEPAT